MSHGVRLVRWLMSLLVFSLLFGSLGWPSQDWPGFRGPGARGQVDAGWPADAGPLEIVWRVKTGGQGHSSPVVRGDRLFLTEEMPDTGKRRVTCLDVRTGTVQWSRSYEFQSHSQHRLNSFAASTPAVDGERLYVSWTSGEKLELLALKLDGEPAWRRDLGAFQAQHGSGASPLLVQGVLIVAKEHEGEDGFLVGLDPATGRDRWRIPRRSVRASYATPVAFEPDGGPIQIVTASTAHGLTGIEPSTGRVLWSLEDLFEQRCVGSSGLVGRTLIQAAGSGGGGKESVTVRLPLDPAKEAPEILFRAQQALPYVPSPIGLGDALFLWSDSGVASCLDRSTGEVHWRERVEGGETFGSPIRIGERFVIGTTSGELLVLRAAAEFGLLQRLELGEPTQATPAWSQGRLFVRTRGALLCLQAGESQ